MSDAHMHHRAEEKNPIPFWRGARSSCHLSDRMQQLPLAIAHMLQIHHQNHWNVT